MLNKIKIGISSCLLGQKVRYDGGHKQDRFITDTLGKFVEFVPVCPEVECGLGVPREAMHLLGTPDSPRLVTIHTRQDNTERMVRWAREKIVHLKKEELLEVIDNYRMGYIPLIVPITLLNHYVRKYDQEYLMNQYYLNPHPIELKLRNHV